ncbi:universal stress protein [Celeribacter persicus]|jgi:Universal stress protein UspA and related nucleotide-binding proteins|uniref:Universal stress protein n=1 Tax=Celeribacter persicus TaxID=1651082 RepID=A0A2T5HGI1_9RHOB|nr:universal stress protein [Celeribacter persicus]PTQ70681.1 nucleotide-binding universal stress UspA family protein [Celeribacter persicus]
MIQTILCAVDVNRVKDEVKVLQQAARLAATEGAQLDVITVIPDYGMSWVGGYFDEKHTKDARNHAKEALNSLVQEALGAEANEKVRHVVAVGTAYHEILETANKDGADLIVLGAHRPDLKDYLLGPNAARVVRHSKCSVFVVR